MFSYSNNTLIGSLEPSFYHSIKLCARASNSHLELFVLIENWLVNTLLVKDIFEESFSYFTCTKINSSWYSKVYLNVAEISYRLSIVNFKDIFILERVDISISSTCSLVVYQMSSCSSKPFIPLEFF